MTYAENWADAINETYEADGMGFTEGDYLLIHTALKGEDQAAAELRVVTKAAKCLRGGVATTFTGPELDFIRHVMPAHEVHQSFAARWVLDNYGKKVKCFKSVKKVKGSK